MNAETNTEVETAETITEAAAQKKQRGSMLVDTAAGTVTVTRADGTKLAPASLADLPQEVRNWLALSKAGSVLQNADKPEEAWASMAAGNIPGRTIDPWHQAVASAHVAEAKKAGAPVTDADALAQARKLTKEQLAAAKEIPAIVTEYRRITGAPKPSVLSLFGGAT